MRWKRTTFSALWPLTVALLLISCSQQTTGTATAKSPVVVSAETSPPESALTPESATAGTAAAPGGPAIRESKATSATVEPSAPTVTETPAPASSPPASPPPANPPPANPTEESTPVGQASAAPTQDLNVPPAIDSGSSGFTSFQSPSSNIFCAILVDSEGSYVRCDISDFSYQVPERVCEGAVGFYAGTAQIDGASPAVIGGCFGDTVADPRYPVLDYRQRAVGGDISCTSTEAGMICQNVLSGYGFRLAKAAVDQF